MKNVGLLVLVLCAVCLSAQDGLLSQRGPTFRVAVPVSSHFTFVAYGDQRFTNPTNTAVTDPKVRKWLAEEIARRDPGAILLNGDVPYTGSNTADYTVFANETKVWRDKKIPVFPALGNHEFRGPDPRECLLNWWQAFPQLQNRRWYSTQLGTRLYAIALDSTSSLLPEGVQSQWFREQVKDLPPSVDFVIVTLHHPPVADLQTGAEADHNPRPNEIALRDLLSQLQAQTHARFIVSSAHIHNYERHIVDNVVYLVSGGGGAEPLPVQRTPGDLFQSAAFPNYHFVWFELKKDRLRATMYRVKDPDRNSLRVEAKDKFEIVMSPR